MAYTIELDTQHLEPVRLEFVQGSVSEPVTFVLKSYTIPSSSTIKLWYRDQYGILYSKTMTQHGDLSAGIFTAALATFIFPGVYTGAVEAVDNNDSTSVYFSFPLIIKVEKNPRYQIWREIFKRDLVPNGSTVTACDFQGDGVNNLTALGDVARAKVSNKADSGLGDGSTVEKTEYYLLPKNTTVYALEGNITLLFDGALVYLTNVNAPNTAHIGPIEVEAYDKSPTGISQAHPAKWIWSA